MERETLSVKVSLPVLGTLFLSLAIGTAFCQPDSASQTNAAAQVSQGASVAAPLRVSYKDGVLSISSENVELSQILLAVREATGAEMDIPEEAAEQPVVFHRSGAARAVLSDLLYGSGLDYAIMSSVDEPTVLCKIVLTTAAQEKSQVAQFVADSRPPAGSNAAEASPDAGLLSSATDGSVIEASSAAGYDPADANKVMQGGVHPLDHTTVEKLTTRAEAKTVSDSGDAPSITTAGHFMMEMYQLREKGSHATSPN